MNASLTKQEVAKLLKVSERTIDYLRSSGELVCVKIGRLVRFCQEDIEAYIQRNRAVLVPAKEKKNP